jgi:rhodanese-related sulfurtransferase
MSIAELRQTLTHALASAEEGNVLETVRALRAALQDVDDERLLTTTEAAQLLGVRSINTIKSWRRTGYIKGVVHGNRTLIPLSEIERIQNSDRVRGIRVAEKRHDESAELGGDEEMSQDELDALDAGRPGTLPWQRGETAQTRDALRPS